MGQGSSSDGSSQWSSQGSNVSTSPCNAVTKTQQQNPRSDADVLPPYPFSPSPRDEAPVPRARPSLTTSRDAINPNSIPRGVLQPLEVVPGDGRSTTASVKTGVPPPPPSSAFDAVHHKAKKAKKKQRKLRSSGGAAPAPFVSPPPVLPQDPSQRPAPRHNPRHDKENDPQQRLTRQVLPQNMPVPAPALTGCVTSTRHDEPCPVQDRCPVRLVGGVKCYMVDEETDCFVFDLLTAEECDELVESAERHVTSASGGEGWRKLYTYTKVSSWCSAM